MASQELNNEKNQATMTYIKTKERNYNMIIMQIHTPNKMKIKDKEH